MAQTADLHIHSSFSDGSDIPEQIVRLALGKDLKCIAITDHDIVDGVELAIAAAEGTSLEVIPGVELSTDSQGSDIHILGYCFDVHNETLKDRLQLFRDARVARVGRIIEKLQALGINISVDDVLSLASSDAVGRPHVAQALLKKGAVRTIPEAFEEYIAEGRPAYVAKLKQTPTEAIRLIQQAGGVAVMAHPMHTLRDELIPGFVQAGLKGMEVYYPNTSRKVIEFYERIADKHNLVKTGGSDAHGHFRSYCPIGMVRVDYSVVKQLREASLRVGV